MHLYSALLCIAVHPKRFTILGGGGAGSLLSHHHVKYGYDLKYPFNVI